VAKYSNAELKQMFGEANFLQTKYSDQKEEFLTDCFPDADSAKLIDRFGNKIVGMRNTQRIRILQARMITREEMEKYG